jgi:hypothetical protein
MEYDAILIHPPATYDFRVRARFPGPIAYTVGESTSQFMIPSVGILSIAGYLDSHGYKVIVDNLSERMLKSEEFDVEEHIKNMYARYLPSVFTGAYISQGAIEIAKLCKKLHPESKVYWEGLLRRSLPRNSQKISFY